MRTTFFIKMLLATLICIGVQKLQAQIPNPQLFNTAADATASGTLILNANDLNWTACITGSLGPWVPALACGNQAPCCWPNSPASNANWISPNHGCTVQAGDHTCLGQLDEYYKLTFDLPAQ